MAHPVACFGELLWDILPDKSLPGGAPMNVAYHLRNLGVQTALITKIGNDDYGKKLVDHLSQHGLSPQFFQVDEEHHTGLVYAKPNDHNEVVYDIVFPSAWDFIEWDPRFTSLVSEAKFFVFGSLTSRNKISRDTLYRLLELAPSKVLDINLRPPYFQRDEIEYLLRNADILKMNIAELELISGWYDQFKNEEESVTFLQERFSIEMIIVTMGGDGAMVNDNGTVHRHNGYKVKVADTIGSGDAFLAGFLSQQLRGCSVKESLSFASGLGAFIATKHGACPSYEIAEITTLMSSGQHQKESSNL